VRNSKYSLKSIFEGDSQYSIASLLKYTMKTKTTPRRNVRTVNSPYVIRMPDFLVPGPVFDTEETWPEEIARWEAWEDSHRRQRQELPAVNPNETLAQEVRREEGVFQQAQLVATLADGKAAKVIG
jgi:hypothetical protein